MVIVVTVRCVSIWRFFVACLLRKNKKNADNLLSYSSLHGTIMFNPKKLGRG